MKPSTNDSEGIVVDSFAAARRSLRIACVTETYPPEVNGVASTMARFVEGLHRRNHDVQLIRPRQAASQSAEAQPRFGETTPRFGETTPRFHEVLMRGLPIPKYPNLRMGVPSKRSLVKLWSTHRPDVVHIATEGPLGYSALQAALHLKLPVCSDFRTNFHAYSKHYGVGWLHRPIMAYLRKFHNRTQATMVPTEALRRDLEAAGFRHVTVVKRGVDTGSFGPAYRSEALRAQWGAAPTDLVVGYVGRLAQEKNLAVLTQAFEAIRRADPRAKLVMVGDGPQRAELQARWPEAVFAGQRVGAELSAHYASFDLFLFPSITETFGNVTPEAMASGLPVVAFDYAAAAQIIQHGVNGRLVPFGDAQAFVAESLALASDSAQRAAMGPAAREAAARLTWDSIVARFETVLLSVMEPPRPLPIAAPLGGFRSGSAEPDPREA
ncbi:MAG TPA: glycosyltransferase family 1 protein [Ideonella sp.]|jgi:glycosyltransferase involved in cell wall biosynthesis|nr:glycosyltransferase family 1 protein [Ideonella sp.]